MRTAASYAPRSAGYDVGRQGVWTTMRHANTRGQGITEYGLIIALVSVLAILGLVILGPAIADLISNSGGSV